MSLSVQIRQHGGPEVLELADVPVGDPGPGEVRIRHLWTERLAAEEIRALGLENIVLVSPDYGFSKRVARLAGLLDCPHYTRPEDYQGMRVPEVLLSGNHALIATWRLKQSLGRTWQRRPDLLKYRTLSKQESRLLAEYQQEQDSKKNQE